MSTYEQKVRRAKRHGELRSRIRQAITMRALHQKNPRQGDEAHWSGRKRRSEARDADYEARRKEVPIDTRSVTARVMGDPLPGRSALDRRQT